MDYSAVRSIKQARRLAGKRVLLRVDFNVPLDGRRVADDTRLREALPTLQYLAKNKARIIIVTHLGRPEGRRAAEYKLDPVAKRLAELWKRKVAKLPDITGPKVERGIRALRPGQALMLENIRFSPDESGNRGTLGRELAALSDIFVQDGFAVSHRGDASVVGVARYLPSYSGLLLDREIKGLAKVVDKPVSPFVLVLGGAKMETKVPVMKNLLPRADFVLVGGGIVNTYLHALGYAVGQSLIDPGQAAEADKYVGRRKVIKPVDVVVGSRDGANYRVVKLERRPHAVCKKNEAILDIGPATIRLFAGYIKQARTLVWNGAMGYFEQKPYDVGTLSIARLVAARSKGPAFGVIGGGETVLAMDRVGMGENIDLISTGGGAMLEFLSGRELPGIAALVRKRS
ncbi:MAG: Phosphoglycerate kinase [Candidatus Magasanikbacteria bacterium GW2011_GWA2_56_11]|uniref:Phosphoglycerate kinase n=1 Tax=Candidatus Magasanikbacteria bacterium GW2011_GWA2_56_11 TaxID=1619044 RepID=A0A0G1YI71_9BACT|nr:MAG: Phosphoglycerate kinase [Candidatus Magasanikbacteria bacterium GW2011_GWA2_56_11]